MRAKSSVPSTFLIFRQEDPQSDYPWIVIECFRSGDGPRMRVCDKLHKTFDDAYIFQWKLANGIKAEFTYPPIPDRRFDWHAYEDGWEPGAPYGEGPTEYAALQDLKEKMDERDT